MSPKRFREEALSQRPTRAILGNELSDAAKAGFQALYAANEHQLCLTNDPMPSKPQTWPGWAGPGHRFDERRNGSESTLEEPWP